MPIPPFVIHYLLSIISYLSCKATLISYLISIIFKVTGTLSPLDGVRKPTASNGNNGGMDMMVDDKGVRINFSSRTGMK